MPWFQIDDGFTTNPKARKLIDRTLDGDYRGLAAVGLWASTGSDINQSTLDGVVSRAGLVRVALNPTVVDELAALLVDAGLWHVAGHSCNRCPQPPPGSFVFHDWADFGYATREEKQLKERKAKELKTSRIRAEVWARDCVSPDRPKEALCRYCGKLVHQKNSRSATEDRAHLDHVDPTITVGSTNIVVACGACNQHKGQRTLAQAEMKLRPPPPHSRHLSDVGGARVSPSVVAEPVPQGVTAAETVVSPGAPDAGTCSPADRPLTSGPPAPDHSQTKVKPGVKNARSAVLARTRADVRRSGSGTGSGLGKGLGNGLGNGQGAGQGEAQGHGRGEAAGGRRKRRRRGRGRAASSPGSSPPREGGGDCGPGAAGVTPQVYVPVRFGSPWANWSGPPSEVADTDCDRHGLPEPCRKCVDESNVQ